MLAALDDFAPTAIEERESAVRVFFASRQHRDDARAQLAGRQVSSVAVDVPDDDWAARSQQNLTPVTVGRITVFPDLRPLISANPESPIPDPCDGSIPIVIAPSMGFGTGHHATTRLCLTAMQTLDLDGSIVVDVGTGSGILAIAAARLGAARVYAIDVDADAVQCANDNLALNPDARNVAFAVADIVSAPMPTADVLVANLTGASLVRVASLLLAAVRSRGAIVVSGILATEEGEVRRAFAEAECCQWAQEEEWVCLTMKKQ